MSRRELAIRTAVASGLSLAAMIAPGGVSRYLADLAVRVQWPRRR